MLSRRKKWFLSGASVSPDTTADGKQGFGWAGNSTATYSAVNGPGVAPTAGTAKEWNGSALVDLGTSLINSGNAGSNKGGPETNFATTYYTATSKKACIADGHVYGSLLYKALDTSQWIGTGFVKGTMYNNFKTKLDGLISNLGLQRPKAIILFDILINDAAAGTETVADLDTAYRALITFLQTDYPNTPIYMVGMATDASSGQNQRAFQIRINQLNTINSFSNVHFWYMGMYSFSCQNMTGKHWNQAQNDAMGRSLTDFLVDTETDWDARRIRNQFFNQMTVTQRGFVSTLVAALKSAGMFQVCNYLMLHCATTQNNVAMEWCGTTSSRADIGAYTFNAKANIQTDGVATYIETYFPPLWGRRFGTQDDIIVMVKVGVNSTPAATLGTLFGPYTATSESMVQLTTSKIRYKCNDNSNTDVTGDTSFQNNTWYGVARDPAVSGSKSLMKGSVKNNTTVVASAAETSSLIEIGARNVNPQDLLAATYTGAFFSAQYGTWDKAAALAAIDAYCASLAAS